MAKILPDKDIRRLMGTALENASPDRLNPNGIELRLGRAVLFHSTGEEAELEEGMFLKVSPGESVVISSLESIDFTTDTVHRVLPGRMLMGLITPTTTMMREGISQVATKIDAGFRGTLNWGLRNGSVKDLVIQFGEPIFKLTVLL
jgi:deoxycytidine triphosphate deaminase